MCRKPVIIPHNTMARTKAIPHHNEGDVKPDVAQIANIPIKKPRRWRPGTVALREIRKYQKSVVPVIPRTRIVRVIRDIASTGGRSIRFKAKALDALHTAAEQEMVRMFERAMLVTINGKGTTLKLKDLKTAIAVAGTC
jgi:histone H3